MQQNEKRKYMQRRKQNIFNFVFGTLQKISFVKIYLGY